MNSSKKKPHPKKKVLKKHTKTARASKKKAVITHTPTSETIRKRPPTEKELKEAAKKIMSLYAVAIKNLANR